MRTRNNKHQHNSNRNNHLALLQLVLLEEGRLEELRLCQPSWTCRNVGLSVCVSGYVSVLCAVADLSVCSFPLLCAVPLRVVDAGHVHVLSAQQQQEAEPGIEPQPGMPSHSHSQQQLSPGAQLSPQQQPGLGQLQQQQLQQQLPIHPMLFEGKRPHPPPPPYQQPYQQQPQHPYQQQYILPHQYQQQHQHLQQTVITAQPVRGGVADGLNLDDLAG